MFLHLTHKTRQIRSPGTCPGHFASQIRSPGTSRRSEDLGRPGQDLGNGPLERGPLLIATKRHWQRPPTYVQGWRRDRNPRRLSTGKRGEWRLRDLLRTTSCTTRTATTTTLLLLEEEEEEKISGFRWPGLVARAGRHYVCRRMQAPLAWLVAPLRAGGGIVLLSLTLCGASECRPRLAAAQDRRRFHKQSSLWKRHVGQQQRASKHAEDLLATVRP